MEYLIGILALVFFIGLIGVCFKMLCKIGSDDYDCFR
jgi:hypothetical protein